MIIFTRFKKGNKILVETSVESKTLPKSSYPDSNRSQRRASVYGKPVSRLISKIVNFRREMISSGISPLPMPRQMNSKVLSGYMSKLVNQAMA